MQRVSKTKRDRGGDTNGLFSNRECNVRDQEENRREREREIRREREGF
jgi:hypothetical protein